MSIASVQAHRANLHQNKADRSIGMANDTLSRTADSFANVVRPRHKRSLLESAIALVLYAIPLGSCCGPDEAVVHRGELPGRERKLGDGNAIPMVGR